MNALAGSVEIMRRAGARPAGLRLVHNVSAITEEASGPSYSVVRLCESLIAEGCDVTLLTLDWAPGSRQHRYEKRFQLALGPRRLGRSPAMHSWLEAKAAAGAVDLLQSVGLWLRTN